MNEVLGVVAFDKDTGNGWGYGNGVKDVDSFIKKLTDQMDAIRETPALSGYCITQLTDVQQEVNGLLDEKRKPKIPLETIRKRNDKFPI